MPGYQTIVNEIGGTKFTVLGAARSGLAAAAYLSAKGGEVFISDTCPTQALEMRLASNGLAHLDHEGEDHGNRVLDSSLIILSPGIPADIPVLKKARKLGIPVWGELELGFRLSAAPFLAITGSTGKSTTTSLLGAIVQAAGKPNTVCGNIGTPVVAVAPEVGPEDFVVAEVSSFQLETIVSFKPRVACILNLFKNHLDRYPGEEEYYNAKKAIASNMSATESLVLNARDDRLVSWALKVRDRTNVVFFGRETGGMRCTWHSGGTLYHRKDNKIHEVFDLREMKLAGTHNYDNACAAAAMAFEAGIDEAYITEGLREFPGLPHRMEFVGEHNGVKYYNDSKATTAESVMCAVTGFDKNVHIIAGGRDKGCDFAALRNAVAEHARQVVLIGEAAERIRREWRGTTEISLAPSLEQAVAHIAQSAAHGDVVVLSPGCSSFDMFANYEQRGDRFRTIVLELGMQKGTA